MNNFSNYNIETSFDNEPRIVKIEFDAVVGDVFEDDDGYYDFMEINRRHYNTTSYDDEVEKTIENIIDKVYNVAKKTYEHFDLIVNPENVKVY